jgi:hypothetical protein
MKRWLTSDGFQVLRCKRWPRQGYKQNQHYDLVRLLHNWIWLRSGQGIRSHRERRRPDVSVNQCKNDITGYHRPANWWHQSAKNRWRSDVIGPWKA